MVRQIIDTGTSIAPWPTRLRLILSALFLVGTFLFVKCDAFAVAPFGDFDPEYYAEKYPDVKKELGEDPYCLYSHYLDLGISEGRYPNKDAELKEAAGDTYIDIDLENQHVTYYENGVAIIECDCVSGDESEGRSTPKGTYQIETMVNGKYLIGPTWYSWVDYWMRFNGTIGLHDATWRSKFGGTIYKKNGSHGCVNIPHDVAEKIFKRVSVGTVVTVR